MRVSNLDKTAEIADYEAEIVHHPAVEAVEEHILSGNRFNSLLMNA